MNCTEFENRVNEQLDRGAMVETPALAEHFAECAACRTWWESAQTLADAIAVWRDEAFDVDLGSAVVFRHNSAGLAGAPISEAPRFAEMTSRAVPAAMLRAAGGSLPGATRRRLMRRG
jgi:hypothetical protein